MQRGPLEITVLQGGEIRALQNNAVKSEIEIPTKILNLIPEGYLITEEDVKDGKVLIRLRQHRPQNQDEEQQIDFQTTVSNYIDADENREIQKSENQTLVRDVKQVAIFALMGLLKSTFGREVTGAILTTAGLPSDVDAFEKYADVLETQANAQVSSEAALSKRVTNPKPGVAKKSVVAPPVSELGSNSLLSLNRRRRVMVKPSRNCGSSKTTCCCAARRPPFPSRRWNPPSASRRKKFVTSAQMENDLVSFDKVQLSVKTAETALALYKNLRIQQAVRHLPRRLS